MLQGGHTEGQDLSQRSCARSHSESVAEPGIGHEKFLAPSRMLDWTALLEPMRQVCIGKRVKDMYFLFQTLSYNRHNLPTETSEKQAKEILIRRQNSLRQSVRKGNSFSCGKPVIVMQATICVIRA